MRRVFGFLWWLWCCKCCRFWADLAAAHRSLEAERNHLTQSTSSSQRITDRSFQFAPPRLWNQLPATLRQPRTNLSNSDSPNPLSGTSSVGSIDSPLSSSITPSLFHFHSSTLPSANPSHRSLPFLQDWLHGFPRLFTYTSEHICFYFFSFSVFTFSCWFCVVD